MVYLFLVYPHISSSRKKYDEFLYIFRNRSKDPGYYHIIARIPDFSLDCISCVPFYGSSNESQLPFRGNNYLHVQSFSMLYNSVDQ